MYRTIRDVSSTLRAMRWSEEGRRCDSWCIRGQFLLPALLSATVQTVVDTFFWVPVAATVQLSSTPRLPSGTGRRHLLGVVLNSPSQHSLYFE